MIVEANRYARSVTAIDPVGKNIRDVTVDFIGRFDLARLARDSSKEHLINISGASGLPQSFYFTFKKTTEYILAFGRLDVEELESMRKEVLALNRELNNLTRELHKKNAELKRLNEEKNRFLGMAAHDLRKPIGLATIYSGFLVEEASGVLNPEHTGFPETIRASANAWAGWWKTCWTSAPSRPGSSP